jgi:hypothetical protein
MAKRAIIGRVTTTKRMQSSRNGNPRFEVTIHTPGTGERTFRTQVDSGLAYGIENPEYRNSEHVYVIDGRDQIECAYALNDSHVAQSLLYALDLDDETAKVIADARRAAQIYEES